MIVCRKIKLNQKIVIMFKWRFKPKEEILCFQVPQVGKGLTVLLVHTEGDGYLNQPTRGADIKLIVMQLNECTCICICTCTTILDVDMITTYCKRMSFVVVDRLS